jgi:hypothetical protein
LLGIIAVYFARPIDRFNNLTHRLTAFDIRRVTEARSIGDDKQLVWPLRANDLKRLAGMPWTIKDDVGD